jgi:hypothetical protein
MTDLLEKAITELHKLPDEEQDTMAGWILAELEDDARWRDSFARSLPQLEQLAQKALDDYHQGQTQALNPDTLS